MSSPAGIAASRASSVGPVDGRLLDGAVPVSGCDDGDGAIVGAGEAEGLAEGDLDGFAAWLDAGGALGAGALPLPSRF